MASENSSRSPETSRGCQVRFFNGTDLLECMTHRRDCQWAKHIGHASLMCNNPSAITLVHIDDTQPSLA